MMNITSDHVKAYFIRVQSTLTEAERGHVVKALDLEYPMVEWAREHLVKQLKETLRQGPTFEGPEEKRIEPPIEYFDCLTDDDRREYGRADSPSAPQLQGYDDLVKYLTVNAVELRLSAFMAPPR